MAEELIAGFGVAKNRVLLAYNKIDLVPGAPCAGEDVRISAVTGAGLAALRAAVVARLEALGIRVPVYGAGPPGGVAGNRGGDPTS